MAFPFHNAFEGVSYVAIPASGITSNIFLVGLPDDYLVIDSGTDPTAGELIATLEAHGYQAGGAAALIVTHGHPDHYGGARALQRWCGAEVWAPRPPP